MISLLDIWKLYTQYASILGYSPTKIILTQYQYDCLWYDNNMRAFNTIYGMTLSISDKLTIS